MSYRACRKVALAVLIIGIACVLVLAVFVSIDTWWLYGLLTALAAVLGFGVHAVWEIVFPDPYAKALLEDIDSDDYIDDDDGEPPDDKEPV